MNNNPLVSVVVATYRRNESLKNAIQSLLYQTYTNIEIIVVDDNDDEEWNTIVRDIVSDANKDERIVLLVNHPNKGSAQTRNRGIETASGEYITFLDDDDVYLPEKIRTQIEKMQADGADFSLTDLTLLNDDGSLSEKRVRKYLLTDEKDDLQLCHLKYHMTGTDTMMFRKDYLMEIGLFEPIDVGDEYYLMMKAIEAGGKFVYLNRCDVVAYVHTGEGGLSSGKGKINGENMLYSFKKKYFKELKRKDIRYIKMRHHAVLAFAFKRSGNIVNFISQGIMAVFVSPIQCVKLLRNVK